MRAPAEEMGAAEGMRALAFGPLGREGRIDALDVLRGVAVLGILLMNIRNFGLPLTRFDDPAFPAEGPAPAANLAAWATANILFEDKMIAIFSMLFGAGIVVLSSRAAAAGLNAAALHVRRVAWLFVIGLVHAYGLWYGDILNTYAVCGLVLYPARRLRPALLIGLGALLLVTAVGIRVAPPVYNSVLAAAVAEGHEAPRPAETRSRRIMREAVRTEEAAYRGSYLDQARWRANLNTAWHLDGGVRFSFWRSGGYMLIGMGLFGLGVLSGQRTASFYAGLALAAYSGGLAFTLLGFAPQLREAFGAVASPEAARAVGQLAWPARFLGAAGVAVGHAAMVMLAMKAAWFRRAARPLAAAGRMALSNYLLQTLICVAIFDGWAMGQWGRWDMLELTALVCAIWTFQLILSPAWLAVFRFGPAEWAWRSLSYWRIQPMLR